MEPLLDASTIRVCNLKDSYAVDVDYGADFRDLVQDGFFNDIHPDIVPPTIWTTGVAPKKESLTILLPSIPREMSEEEILALLKEKHCSRPANITELLALAAQHQELQWECPIVGLGSKWRNRGGDSGVAYLWHNPFGRALLLALLHPEKKWLPICRFAAVSLGE